MSSAGRSLFAFGVYVVIAGLSLAIVPALVLAVLRFPPATDGWIRVVGVLALCIGSFHIVGARNELLPYIRATVYARTGLAFIFIIFVVTAIMPAPLLVFAGADAIGAAWTALALRGAQGNASYSSAA
jgi:hypothetical protein